MHVSPFMAVLLGGLACTGGQGTTTDTVDTGDSDTLADTGDSDTEDTEDTEDTGPVDTDTDTGPDPFAALKDLIEEERVRGNIPGLAVALVVGGEVVLAEGFGWANVEEGVPATGDTPFMLASVSKLFIGTAVMQAVEDGAFTLEDPVNDILPFVLDNPRTEDEVVTVAHLATHTSSIKDNYDVWYPIGDKETTVVWGDSTIALGDFLESYLVAGGEWYDPNRNFYSQLPGFQYHYSNIGADLAGYLLEVGTGIPLDDHSEAEIFGPLGMTHTGWHLADHDEDLVAMPYVYESGEFVPFGQYGYPDYPCGQLRASAADLGRFMAAYARGGELDGQRILEAETIETMWSAPFPDVEDTQGVFWYRTAYGELEVIGHGGSDYGVSTSFYYDPVGDVGIIRLSNIASGPGSVLAMIAIEEALLEAGQTP